jgi:hypothetical protein
MEAPAPSTQSTKPDKQRSIYTFLRSTSSSLAHYNDTQDTISTIATTTSISGSPEHLTSRNHPPD